MSSRVSERVAAAPKAKAEVEPKTSGAPAPPPSQPKGWTAPKEKANDGWKAGTAPRPSIAPPPAPLVSDAPVFSARALASAQPPPATVSSMNRVLKLGVAGSDVQQLQERLKELGFEISRTGKYDTRTERAVEAFQRRNDLKVDGDAGRNTLRALGFTYGASSTTSAEPHAVGSRILKRGMEGDDVQALQQRLSENGQGVRPTGSYDAATQRAVENFQRERGLQVDGDAGRETLTSLGFTFRRARVDDALARVRTEVPPRTDVTPRAEVTPRTHVTPRADVTPRTDVTPHVHDEDEPHVHDTLRTDTPTPPVRIARNAALGDVREREAIAARITVGRGTDTNEADIAAVRAEAARLPLDALRDLQRAGVKIVACRDSVVDAVPSLRNAQPRGWAPGRGWQDVPGAYMPSTKEVVVATRTSPTGTREVSPFGHRHGSVSLVAHEAGHALDAARGEASRRDEDFQRAYQQDLRGGQLLPYYTQGGDAGASEAYAESLALYLSGDRTGDGARRFAGLMGYWQQKFQPEGTS